MEGHTHPYPMPTGTPTRKRQELAPELDRAFREFSRLVFAAGAVAKSLIAIRTMEADRHRSGTADTKRST